MDSSAYKAAGLVEWNSELTEWFIFGDSVQLDTEMKALLDNRFAPVT